MADATGFFVQSPHPAGSPAGGELQALDDLSRRLLTDQAEALDAE